MRIPDPEARLEQYPHQLSGGQRQRVMIAIAIANSPELLIADEPTTALDVTVQAEILKLIRQLQRSHGMAVVLITHDLTIVEKVLRLRRVMRLGRVLEHEHHAASSSPRPRHAYTQRLLASRAVGRRPNPVDGERRVGARERQACASTITLKKGTFFKPVYVPLVAVDNVDICRCSAPRRSASSASSAPARPRFGQAILRLHPAQSGEISFDGRPPRRPRPQGRCGRSARGCRSSSRTPSPRSTRACRVQQILEEGLIVNGIGGAAPGTATDRIKAALVDVGMPDNT